MEFQCEEVKLVKEPRNMNEKQKVMKWTNKENKIYHG